MVDPRRIAQKVTQELRATFGDDLRSVVLFGSVPRGEAIPGVSDVNILVLLDVVGPAQLAQAAPLVQEWIRKGNTPPHVYSMDEWGGMRDTFAIEMADMQDAREVLWGDDPVAQTTVRAADLRTHAEQEMRQTLLHMRLRSLVSANDPAELSRLLLAGLPSFTAYMRAALRLAGEQPGPDSLAVIERAAGHIGADPEPMRTCWRARRNLEPLAVSIGDPLLVEYNRFNQALVRHLDQLTTDVARRLGAAAVPTSTH